MQVFIHTAAISRMCLILSLLIPKKERDKWYSKNEYDYNGFLQAEKLYAREVYKITGRKMTNWCKIKIGDYYILLKI